MKDTLRRTLIKPKMPMRLFMVLFGQVVLGLGVALLKLSGQGNDPFSAMMMALTEKTTLSYGNFCAIGNCVFFVIEILFGRKYIGIGTIVNWFALGYVVEFWTWVFDLVGFSKPDALALCILICIIALPFAGFGLSLYQSADIGSSPYDCLPLIMNDRLHIPFFLGRIIADGCCLVITFFAGGILGFGTVMVVLCLGPTAAFINRNFSEKLVKE